MLLSATNTVTDSKYYNYYVNGERLEKVFPAKIPSNAKNIEFYYVPGILQSGTSYSLYYIDDSMTKENFDKELELKRINTDFSPLALSGFLHLPNGGTFCDNPGGAFINDLGIRFYENVILD